MYVFISFLSILHMNMFSFFILLSIFITVSPISYLS